jgi:hygromycin-B 4-O-kinase
MKKPTTVTQATAAEVFQHHFGSKPRRIQNIHGGLNNFVFEARMGSDELILRISCQPDHLQKFMKEQWAVNAARKKQVPTPEILEVCNDVIELPYMISRKVTGTPAHELEGDRNAVVEQLGHYAAVINNIKTHDFGHIFDWSPNKLSRNRSWNEYLDNELAVDERVEALRTSRVVESSVLHKIQREIQAMRKWRVSPTLSHGDIRLKNVVLDKRQKIVAILDWENCTSNVSPQWELSIALHDLNIDEKEVFLRGYGIELKEYMRIASGVKILNILNYARSVRHAIDRKNTARLMTLRSRLLGAFDLYTL